MNRRTIIFGIAVLGLVVAPLMWWLVSPLWRTDAVDEAFPFDTPTQAEMESMTADEAAAKADELAAKVMEMADEMTEAQINAVESQVGELSEMMNDIVMVEEMPEVAQAWAVVAQGMFQDADQFHTGSGTASIYSQGEQSVLRLEEFMVTNGPDLHVLLVENINGTSSSELGEYIDLGSLKGNVGNQNYEIPAGTDLSKYSGVMIYCMPFHVVFATAGF